MLTGMNVLIVEDEALVACDLAWAVEALNGIVIGPASTVFEALALIDATHVSGAILDANLADRDVTPLALRLIDTDIPFIVHTGTGLPDALKASHPDLPVMMKPTASAAVLARLDGMIGEMAH